MACNPRSTSEKMRKMCTKNIPIVLSDWVKEALKITKHGAQELLVEIDLVHKFQLAEKSGNGLRVKLGLDPTAPDLHLGHTVVLNKLRQLQDLGSNVVLLIGDFTSMIGDPSGRNKMRPTLLREQIEENAKTYFSQASLILDPERVEIRYNSEWLDNLSGRDMIQLSAKYTVARILEREDFTRRFKAATPIAVHELLYPLIQGYDSVVLGSDLELGGTDQKFNLLTGRELQKDYCQDQQCILTMPLLEGLDGVKKMSKSKGNYIGITEHANIMFSKIMSISDVMMWRYYNLISFQSSSQIASYKNQVEHGRNPRDIKVILAKEIVARFHDLKASENAVHDFNNRANGGVPENISEVHLTGAPIGIGQLLKQVNLCSSISEALRIVDQGGIRINGAVVSDKGLKIGPANFVIQVGKRKFSRVVLST